MPAEVPAWQRGVAIPGMLFFGTCTVVIQKFLFEQSGMGRKMYPEHKFKKPWFQTNSMFIGMLLALAVYEVQRIFKRRKEAAYAEMQVSLASDTGAQVEEEKKSTSHWKMYLYVAAPACCDLIATAMSNVGLLFIEASVWQMFRGSMVLFSSIFCAFILKRPHFPYMWWSVLLIMIALVVVGLAAVFSTGLGKAGVSQGQVVMAIMLVVAAQVVQASQIVVEDFLLHDIDASPFLIVGLEGFWGTIIVIALVLPITQYVHGEEGNGIHEDTIDTLLMLGKQALILVFVIIYVLVILAYNVTGMFVTQISSAVVRTILEGLRTLCIWIVQLIIHYATDKTDYGHKHPDIGEAWTIWSYMQAVGFLLLFTGMLLYNKILRVPIFKYPADPAVQSSEILDPQPLVIEDKGY
jgi:hypothetical protein